MIDRKIQQSKSPRSGPIYLLDGLFLADHLLSLAFVFLRVCGPSIKNRKAEQIELTRCKPENLPVACPALPLWLQFGKHLMTTASHGDFTIKMFPLSVVGHHRFQKT